MKLTVLFGTVEYFERELLEYTAVKSLQEMGKDYISAAYSRLEDELLNDFICDDKVKAECLRNLSVAKDRLEDKIFQTPIKKIV
ncbi:hypothetical protein [Bacillus sp. V3-13]|uniref:hypothetical protein n=1 Tax=Bacillus sp. V3-13 TaxID=2053728 RepID=UPI0021527BFE|nr:hypothetical protein [Bacillus sp. V3-13]